MTTRTIFLVSSSYESKSNTLRTTWPRPCVTSKAMVKQRDKHRYRIHTNLCGIDLNVLDNADEFTHGIWVRDESLRKAQMNTLLLV